MAIGDAPAHELAHRLIDPILAAAARDRAADKIAAAHIIVNTDLAQLGGRHDDRIVRIGRDK